MATRKGGPPRASRQAALTAMRRWIETNGRLPAWSDWEHTVDGRPSAKTINRRWGWDSFRAAAAGVPRRLLHELSVRARTGFTGHGWTRTGLPRPLMAEYVRGGSWPTAKHWETATAEHPSRRTYVRRFGSWDQAVDAAARELMRLAAPRG